MDEFVWTPKGTKRLPRLLETRYEDYYRISMLVCSGYGTNYISQPVSRPVIESFTRRASASFPYDDGDRFGYKALYCPIRVWYIVQATWCFTCRTTMVPG